MTVNPYGSHRFWIELNGITEGSFSEVSGLDFEIEVEDRMEGGLNDMVHRIPGRVKVAPNIVLKRGLATAELWQWYYDITQGKLTHGPVTRKNMSIILFGYDKMPQIRWNITGALPVKWSGPTFKSDAGEVPIELLELIHQGIVRV